MDPARRYLIQDYHEDREAGAAFDGHGVLAPQADGAGYLWFWFDSFGYLPTPAGSGRWDGDRLVLIRTSPRGANHSVFRIEPQRLSYEVAFQAAGQDGMMPVMAGSFARRGR